MNLGYLVVRFYFLNYGNLICRRTDISMYFRESLGVRDNESRLYLCLNLVNTALHNTSAMQPFCRKEVVFVFTNKCHRGGENLEVYNRVLFA